LDNFSQDINEEDEDKKIDEQNSKDQGIEDIQFEETINIEDLQKQLLKKIDQSNLGIETPEEEEIEEQASLPSEDEKPVQSEPKISADSNAKKYVIYINPDNVDYMESLSISERRELINKILKEQNTISIKKKELDEKKRYITNVILACLTFIICFPILFILVNKSTEISIINYNQAKENFSKLYKEKSRINKPISDSTRNGEY